jgi:hypothetical protein
MKNSQLTIYRFALLAFSIVALGVAHSIGFTVWGVFVFGALAGIGTFLIDLRSVKDPKVGAWAVLIIIVLLVFGVGRDFSLGNTLAFLGISTGITSLLLIFKSRQFPKYPLRRPEPADKHG